MLLSYIECRWYVECVYCEHHWYLRLLTLQLLIRKIPKLLFCLAAPCLDNSVCSIDC